MTGKKRMLLRCDNKGSLTVEAAVILPLFLCFCFFMMFVVKAVCVYMALDQAVHDTAREIAASAYPLSYVNERIDELEEAGNLDKEPSAYLDKLLDKLFSGALNEKDLQELLLEISGARLLEEVGFDGKNRLEHKIAAALLEKKLQGSPVDSRMLSLLSVRFPQGKWEYEHSTRAGGGEAGQMLPSELGGRDDVAILVEYKLALPLAFVRDRHITLKHAAVERAWLAGGNGVYSNRQEQGIFDQRNDEETVFVTRTGTKYHADGCRYLKKSKIPLSLEEARASYEPCKVCRPEEKLKNGGEK